MRGNEVHHFQCPVRVQYRESDLQKCQWVVIWMDCTHLHAIRAPWDLVDIAQEKEVITKVGWRHKNEEPER